MKVVSCSRRRWIPTIATLACLSGCSSSSGTSRPTGPSTDTRPADQVDGTRGNGDGADVSANSVPTALAEQFLEAPTVELIELANREHAATPVELGAVAAFLAFIIVAEAEGRVEPLPDIFFELGLPDRLSALAGRYPSFFTRGPLSRIVDLSTEELDSSCAEICAVNPKALDKAGTVFIRALMKARRLSLEEKRVSVERVARDARTLIEKDGKAGKFPEVDPLLDPKDPRAQLLVEVSDGFFYGAILLGVVPGVAPAAAVLGTVLLSTEAGLLLAREWNIKLRCQERKKAAGCPRDSCGGSPFASASHQCARCDGAESIVPRDWEIGCCGKYAFDSLTQKCCPAAIFVGGQASAPYAVDKGHICCGPFACFPGQVCSKCQDSYSCSQPLAARYCCGQQFCGANAKCCPGMNLCGSNCLPNQETPAQPAGDP